MNIGTCSICGGAVTVPQVWHGIIPPTPRCSSCGAVPATTYGPVIQMRPQMITEIVIAGPCSTGRAGE